MAVLDLHHFVHLQGRPEHEAVSADRAAGRPSHVAAGTSPKRAGRGRPPPRPAPPGHAPADDAQRCHGRSARGAPVTAFPEGAPRPMGPGLAADHGAGRVRPVASRARSPRREMTRRARRPPPSALASTAPDRGIPDVIPTAGVATAGRPPGPHVHPVGTGAVEAGRRAADGDRRRGPIVVPMITAPRLTTDPTNPDRHKTGRRASASRR